MKSVYFSCLLIALFILPGNAFALSSPQDDCDSSHDAPIACGAATFLKAMEGAWSGYGNFTQAVPGGMVGANYEIRSDIQAGQDRSWTLWSHTVTDSGVVRDSSMTMQVANGELYIGPDSGQLQRAEVLQADPCELRYRLYLWDPSVGCNLRHSYRLELTAQGQSIVDGSVDCEGRLLLSDHFEQHLNP